MTPPSADSTIDITPAEPVEINFLGDGMDSSGVSLNPGQPAAVELGAGSIDIYCMDKYQLMPLSGSGLTWSSDNEKIATVDSNGLVTTKAAGTAVITAADSSGSSDSCTVNVIKVAYLTIDDVPTDDTLKMLDIFDQHGITATFFFNANEKQAEHYREIYRRGHRMALHGYKHNTTYRNTDKFLENMEKCRDFLVETIGCRPDEVENIIRFPTGSKGKKNYKTILKEIQKRGYTAFDWTTEFHDFSYKNPDNCLAYFKKYLKHDRAVILIHSKKQSLAALPEAVEYALAQGYVFAPLTEYTTQHNFHRLYIED